VALAAALAGFGASGVAGCGGAGDIAEDEIRKVIERAVRSNDPSDCRTLQTQDFREQTTGERGQEALRECQEEIREDDPGAAVRIAKVSVDGDTADARFRGTGGQIDGQELGVELVEVEGRWKLDRIADADISRPEYDRALRKDLTSGRDALTSSVADCVLRRFSRISDSEIERAIVAGDYSQARRIGVACLADGPPDQLRRLFERGLRRDLARRGLSDVTTDCIIDRSREFLSNAELLVLVRGERPRELAEAFRRAGENCQRATTSG
jgi:hypothetical protein